MTIDKLLEEIAKLDFIVNVQGDLSDSRYRGEFWKAIEAILPERETITNEWNQKIIELLAYLRECPLDSVESIIRKLPAGYIRMNAREIYRERQQG